MLELTDNPDVNTNDYVMAKNMADRLHKSFPGHLWAVTCDGKTGIATVRNMMLSGNWGFVLHLKELFGDPGMKCVIRAGGEILERYRLHAGRLMAERIDELPMLPTGVPVFDPGSAHSKIPDIVRKAYDVASHNAPPEPQNLIIERGWNGKRA